MRVKIGDTWHDVTVDTPIMLVLTEKDRENIAKMAPGCTKYAAFVDGDPRGLIERLAWME